MNESIYKSYDELPLFLNAPMVAGLLGVSPSSAYELMLPFRRMRRKSEPTKAASSPIRASIARLAPGVCIRSMTICGREGIRPWMPRGSEFREMYMRRRRKSVRKSWR